MYTNSASITYIYLYSGTTYSTVGNRITLLSLLSDYIKEITHHAAVCGYPMEFLGESAHLGLCSVLAARCTGCKLIMKMHASKSVVFGQKSHYETNLGAVLGQVATGGGGDHLQEQLSAMNIPSLSPHSFIQFERDLGTAFESLVTEQLLIAGREEYEHAAATNCRVNGKLACTVVVDGGWSKRYHRHSYNAKSGVGVIFGAHTKKLLL